MGTSGVKTTFDHADPTAHWRSRLADGLAHDLGLVIAKAVHGQLADEVPQADIVRQVALFGAQNRERLGGVSRSSRRSPISYLRCRRRNLSRPVPRRAPRGGGLRRRGAAAGNVRRLGSRAGSGRAQALAAALENVRHREAPSALCSRPLRPVPPAVLADALLAADTERAFADTGHSALDFHQQGAFECLDLIGWEHASAVLATVVGQW